MEETNEFPENIKHIGIIVTETGKQSRERNEREKSGNSRKLYNERDRKVSKEMKGERDYVKMEWNKLIKIASNQVVEL